MNITENINSVCQYSEKNIVHKMNGIVLCNVQDALFDLHVLVSREVKKYCKDLGFFIDKVVFVNLYDSSNFEKMNKLASIKSGDKSEIIVVETDKKEIIAYLYNTTHIELNYK